MSNLAYVRVSSVEQNTARQELAINNEAKIDKWFIEKASAKNTNRSELNSLLNYIRKDDVIYIHGLDRLARNTKDLLDIMEKLDIKGVKLYSINDNFDFNSSTGKLLLTVLGAVAEFERNILRERQAEGIAIAKKNGVYKGRKKIYTNEHIGIKHALELRESTNKTVNEICTITGISKSTFYRNLKNK